MAPLVLTRYTRETFPPDTLARLWAAMAEEGATAKVFHASPTQGDLVDFVRMVEPPPPAQTVTLIAHTEDASEIAGLFWFGDLVPGVRASANVWYRRKWWGAAARQASKDALAWGFAHLGVPAIWAYTPWPEAARHAEAVGFHPVATFPAYDPDPAGPKDLYVLRAAKESE